MEEQQLHGKYFDTPRFVDPKNKALTGPRCPNCHTDIDETEIFLERFGASHRPHAWTVPRVQVTGARSRRRKLIGQRSHEVCSSPHRGSLCRRLSDFRRELRDGLAPSHFIPPRRRDLSLEHRSLGLHRRRRLSGDERERRNCEPCTHCSGRRCPSVCPFDKMICLRRLRPLR